MCKSKILADLFFTKQKIKTKIYKSYLQCFSSKNVLNNHKEGYLNTNCTQSVKLEKGTIEFKNLFKQIQVQFKIYADFECILTSAEKYEGSRSKKYQDHIPCSFTYQLLCVDDKSIKQIVPYGGKKIAYKSNKANLEEYEYCKKVMKKKRSSLKKKNNFNQLRCVGYVKNLVKILMKKLEINVA